MEQPKFIDYKKPDNKGLDFDFLREEGIHIIQKLTGAFWTDYNEHDPGVTILEQLCYALTEISYRTQFDIKDILYSEDQSEQSFFKPDQVLPCNALTINDYRKLIFDSVFEIKNVWLFPVIAKNSEFNGLYRILLDVDESINIKNNRQKVLDKALNVFNENRNLCEDIEEINILDPMVVSLIADIDLTGEISQEKVMAQILYKVDEYLCPEIKFYSLEELIEQGYSLSEIFNGPLLKHGFVKTDELPAKIDKILISEIMKIIMQIDGVSSVKNLKLMANGEEYDNQITIDPYQLPKLAAIDIETKAQNQINFFKNGITNRNINIDESNRHLNEMRSANRRVYRLSEETIEVPKGTQLDLKSYYSIQNQFPNIYGIGEDGIPNSPSEKRKGQAMQLKGYLMLFEQILANSLAQLHNTKELLAIGGSYSKSYYSQTLHSVPQSEKLFKNTDQYEIDLFSPSNEEIPINYKEGLPKIMEMGEDNHDRIQRLLDYLLALHGEEFGNSLKQFNYYFTPHEFNRFLITNKTYFLQFLPFINKNRTRGFNYSKPTDEIGNISGIEAKISVLLGLSSFVLDKEQKHLIYQKKSFFEHFNSYNLQLVKSFENQEKAKLFKSISESKVKDRFEIVDEEDIHIDALLPEQKNKILEKSIFKSSGVVTIKHLQDGLNIENYRIGKINDQIKSTSVVFYSKETEEWIELAKYLSYEDAELAVMLHLNLFKELSIKSEGIHVMEHILLRPGIDENKFGIYLLDPQGKRMLASDKNFTYHERIEILDQLKEHIKVFENYSVEITSEKDFEIHLNIKELDLKFVSIHANESVEATHAKLENLYEFLINKRDIIPFDKKIGFFIKNSENSQRIPESFYSNRMSSFFPDWTARFGNPEFKAIAEEVVFKQQPASVALTTNWLGIEQMQKFEQKYFNWAQLKAPQQNNAAFQKAVDELTTFIFQFYKMDA